MLSINPKKQIKVIIFQKRAKKCIESNFHIDNEPIVIFQNYIFLGTLNCSTGNFSLALDKLKEKALHALFSHTNFSKLPGSFPKELNFRRNDLPSFDI